MSPMATLMATTLFISQLATSFIGVILYFNSLYPYVDLDAGGSIEGMVGATNLALTMANETTVLSPSMAH